MKHVLLTLLVFAASTHAAPILADVPAELSPVEAHEEEAIDESSDMSSEEEEALPHSFSRQQWVCRAVWSGPFVSKIYSAAGPTRKSAESLALKKCMLHNPPVSPPFGPRRPYRSRCVLQNCHREFGPIPFDPSL
jgi:hypothetical protein